MRCRSAGVLAGRAHRRPTYPRTGASNSRDGYLPWGRDGPRSGPNDAAAAFGRRGVHLLRLKPPMAELFDLDPDGSDNEA